MKARLIVPPLGWVARFADTAMIPLMYLLSGTLRESPQSTHYWNNLKLFGGALKRFNRDQMVWAESAPQSLKKHYFFLFHAPILGGWREYLVVEPVFGRDWYIGWTAGLVDGISRIRISGPARVLRGPEGTFFFGVDAETGEQIPIRQIGTGRIGKSGPFSRIPLI